jgi:hypothetical protein
VTCCNGNRSSFVFFPLQECRACRLFEQRTKTIIPPGQFCIPSVLSRNNSLQSHRSVVTLITTCSGMRPHTHSTKQTPTIGAMFAFTVRPSPTHQHSVLEISNGFLSFGSSQDHVFAVLHLGRFRPPFPAARQVTIHSISSGQTDRHTISPSPVTPLSSRLRR